MAKKEFTYRGKTLEELKSISINDFAELVPARQRRSLKREATDLQKVFIKKIIKGNNIKTECRDIIIIPKMVGKNIRIHNGKEFIPVLIQPEMIGHRLGEFVFTRKRVMHHAPGVGATRSSASLSVR
ncbi:30S ribosomal protein S19 [Candidatus Woesearchaeota archaeon CG_4_10_14_0_2_um_filter_33_10]|nr:MAG: 30S ribosomal protein S19 [Candidatus Woesearchaeota archaeon CG1_02_33_12]PIN78347.1 MAG: 30S ribosomal protein S19 [Candidatus Woesearchaeota archaeon CG10_big_fil_rev_8_21_14_0_10_33_12]PIU72575.1 MAG: 30S ribosomal protein S19 [Candidatus Woesearchaeota archaeon CG06_land_8_20_14_3_00_33_13]PIZ53647.1 MAG: 30S ribosomal protein S19 [Candidatus Woesearchaeota archaeon CG_4_10_14_0_2_um_filter_33_10]